MRSKTAPFPLGRPARRPEPSKGTANREARISTATSFRLLARASTSRARRRLRSAGMRTRTSLRSRAIAHSDSTNVLSAVLKLLADEEDPLDHGQPSRSREEGDRDREDEVVEWGEAEPRGNDDDPLGPAAEADVTLEPQRLRPRPRVADKERARDRRERERDGPHLVVPHEHEPDRAEHEPLAHTVDSRVEERPEGTARAAAAGERAVEDVEDRSDDEERGSKPVERP